MRSRQGAWTELDGLAAPGARAARAPRPRRGPPARCAVPRRGRRSRPRPPVVTDRSRGARARGARQPRSRDDLRRCRLATARPASTCCAATGRPCASTDGSCCWRGSCCSARRCWPRCGRCTIPARRRASSRARWPAAAAARIARSDSRPDRPRRSRSRSSRTTSASRSARSRAGSLLGIAPAFFLLYNGLLLGAVVGIASATGHGTDVGRADRCRTACSSCRASRSVPRPACGWGGRSSSPGRAAAFEALAARRRRR